MRACINKGLTEEQIQTVSAGPGSFVGTALERSPVISILRPQTVHFCEYITLTHEYHTSWQATRQTAAVRPLGSWVMLCS